MKNGPIRKITIGTLITLIIFTLSCSFSSINPFSIVTPTATSTPIPISSQQAGELVEEVQYALETARSGGKVEIVITESQLTSMAAIELQSMQEVNIQEIQVHLQNGQVLLTGKVQQNNISLPFSITAEIYVKEEGKLGTNIIAAKLGPLPVPQSLLDDITSRIDQALMNQVYSSNNNIAIETIVINNGTMTITGYLR